MKKSQAIKKNENHASELIVCGSFSKKDAALLIGRGTQHVHSSPMGPTEPSALVTQEILKTGKHLVYPWEKAKESTQIFLSESADRYTIFNGLVADAEFHPKRALKEKVHSVLEELVTNAIYHAYRNKDGSRRFPRRQSASLSKKEQIELRFHGGEDGIYLAVTDFAGTLSFADLVQSITRCYYGAAGNQIQNKESGAGLGMYMVFEAATHLKIEVMPGNQCTISVWLAEKHAFDPGFFSFNYYEGR